MDDFKLTATNDGKEEQIKLLNTLKKHDTRNAMRLLVLEARLDALETTTPAATRQSATNGTIGATEPSESLAERVDELAAARAVHNALLTALVESHLTGKPIEQLFRNAIRTAPAAAHSVHARAAMGKHVSRIKTLISRSTMRRSRANPFIVSALNPAPVKRKAIAKTSER